MGTIGHHWAPLGSIGEPFAPKNSGVTTNHNSADRNYSLKFAFPNDLNYQATFIENADVTPPHLDVSLRLGGSAEMLCSLRFFALGLLIVL